MSGSGISWAICKSAPCSRQITLPAPHHSFFTRRMPFLPPNQQRQSTEGRLDKVTKPCFRFLILLCVFLIFQLIAMHVCFSFVRFSFLVDWLGKHIWNDLYFFDEPDSQPELIQSVLIRLNDFSLCSFGSEVNWMDFCLAVTFTVYDLLAASGRASSYCFRRSFSLHISTSKPLKQECMTLEGWDVNTIFCTNFY